MPISPDQNLSIDYSLLRDMPCLLAFSHGVDSTALFYLLREKGIRCDLAFVHYGLRAQADREEAAARKLAEDHGLRIFVARAPYWKSGFERHAREYRYRFFEEIIEQEGYRTLLTAHQLNDRLEWLMMRLGRGAGAVELAGLRAVEERRTSGGKRYRLVRPLLETSRQQLQAYLDQKGCEYFIDESNESMENERAGIRMLCRDYVEAHREGIRRTFRYLNMDRAALEECWKLLFAFKGLRVYRLTDPGCASRAADEGLKTLGYLLSASERELIDRGESLVAGRMWAVERYGSHLYIAPYLVDETLPKKFREACREAKIPPKIRPYCYREKISINELIGKIAKDNR